jgi:hypothetical protein
MYEWCHMRFNIGKIMVKFSKYSDERVEMILHIFKFHNKHKVNGHAKK